MPTRLICVVSSLSLDSEARFALNLCRDRVAAGWSVTAYTRDANAVDSELRKSAIPLRHAPLLGFLDMTSVPILSRDFKLEEKGAIILVQRFRDAFIVNMAMKLACRNDLKVVMMKHSAQLPRNTRLGKYIYSSLHALIFSSSFARSEFQRAWLPAQPPCPSSKTHTIYNSLYAPLPRIEEKEHTGLKIALYYGPIAPGHGLELLIDTLPALKECRTRLWIAGLGNPDYIDTLRRRALSKSVMSLIDWKTGDYNLHDLLPKVTYGVFPYTTPDAFGYQNIEFMAAGVPQITSRLPIAMEYFGTFDAPGITESGSSEALAENIIKMSTDADFRKRAADFAYQRYSSALSWDELISRFMRIL